MIKKIKSNFFWVIFSFFLALHFFPYIKNPVPLGYDAGLYLHIFKTFPHVQKWLEIGFSPGLFALFYPIFLVDINPEVLLIPISIISQVFLFFAIFYVSKKLTGEKIALITSFLFTVSLVQFRTYWFFYVRNSFALGLLLLSLYFLTNKKFVLSLIFGIILCLFHLPTALIYFFTLIILMLFDKKNFVFYLKVLVLTAIGGLLYYLPNFKISILPFLGPVTKSIAPVQVISGAVSPGGTFYSIPTSFLMTIFYLPFAFFGAYIVRTEQKQKPFLITFVLLFLMVVTQFFFSRRYFIPLDLFLIFFAGIGLNFIIEKYKNQKENFFFYFAVLIIFIIVFIIKTGQPLIEKNVFYEIKDFGNTYKNANILSTSKEDHAWLMGYTNNPVIAYGFGGYDKYWDSKQWLSFLSGKDVKEEIKLLKIMPKPLFIFLNDKTAIKLKNISGSECLKSISMHFYKFICN